MAYQPSRIILCQTLCWIVLRVSTVGVSVVHKFSANIYELAGRQSVKTKAYMSNGKLQSLDLMQPCYLEGVSFVLRN